MDVVCTAAGEPRRLVRWACIYTGNTPRVASALLHRSPLGGRIPILIAEEATLGGTVRLC